MGSLLAYSGVSAKLRGMSSYLLSEEDYKQLAQSANVTEAVEFFKGKKGFEMIFSNVTTDQLHRATMEKLLFLAEYRQFEKIYRFSNTGVRKFLDLYFMNYERTILRMVLRNIADHRVDATRNINPGGFFTKHASFDMEKIMGVRTFKEFVDALQGSGYYKYLMPLAQQENLSLFDYEMAIDVYIFSTIWKRKKNYFKGEDYENLTKTYGTQFDLLNLSWIYRSKKYYQFSASEIYKIIIPVYYKINRNTIRQLAESVELDELEKIIKESYYGKRYKDILGIEQQAVHMDDLYHVLLFHVHQKETRKSPFSIAIVNSYLYKKHLETERIITTIEGIRYGLPAEKIIEVVSPAHLLVGGRSEISLGGV